MSNTLAKSPEIFETLWKHILFAAFVQVATLQDMFLFTPTKNVFQYNSDVRKLITAVQWCRRCKGAPISSDLVKMREKSVEISEKSLRDFTKSLKNSHELPENTRKNGTQNGVFLDMLGRNRAEIFHIHKNVPAPTRMPEGIAMIFVRTSPNELP